MLFRVEIVKKGMFVFDAFRKGAMRLVIEGSTKEEATEKLPVLKPEYHYALYPVIPYQYSSEFAPELDDSHVAELTLAAVTLPTVDDDKAIRDIRINLQHDIIGHGHDTIGPGNVINVEVLARMLHDINQRLCVLETKQQPAFAGSNI